MGNVVDRDKIDIKDPKYGKQTKVNINKLVTS